MRILWMILVALFRIAVGLAGVALSLFLVILAIGSEQASAEDEDPLDHMPMRRGADGIWYDAKDRPVC